MSYQRLKKGGQVAKSPFLEKKCAKIAYIIKKRIFSKKKSAFFESPITHKRSIF